LLENLFCSCNASIFAESSLLTLVDEPKTVLHRERIRNIFIKKDKKERYIVGVLRAGAVRIVADVPTMPSYLERKRDDLCTGSGTRVTD
jgi:hypothetical protein